MSRPDDSAPPARPKYSIGDPVEVRRERFDPTSDPPKIMEEWWPATVTARNRHGLVVAFSDGQRLAVQYVHVRPAGRLALSPTQEDK